MDYVYYVTCKTWFLVQYNLARLALIRSLYIPGSDDETGSAAPPTTATSSGTVAVVVVYPGVVGDNWLFLNQDSGISKYRSTCVFVPVYNVIHNLV